MDDWRNFNNVSFESIMVILYDEGMTTVMPALGHSRCDGRAGPACERVRGLLPPAGAVRWTSLAGERSPPDKFTVAGWVQCGDIGPRRN